LIRANCLLSLAESAIGPGIFSVKPFTEYTAEEFRRFVSVNLEGFIFVSISDDGVGFTLNAANARPGLGLTSMRENFT
jgi:hypothetical protein